MKKTKLANSSKPNDSTSELIRDRLVKNKARYYANDNISEFVSDQELILLIDEVADKVEDLLHSLVIDTQNDHNTKETSRRVAKMFVNEIFAGRYKHEPQITRFPNVSKLNELMIVGPITVRSSCSHHLCPITGKIWIGVLPDAKSELIGLSKYTRLTEWVMQRPQIQEEAVVQLANLLEKHIKPSGLAVVMTADHLCMQWRGVKDNDSKMVNSVMRGALLKNANLRREFLSLIKP